MLNMQRENIQSKSLGQITISKYVTITRKYCLVKKTCIIDLYWRGPKMGSLIRCYNKGSGDLHLLVR